MTILLKKDKNQKKIEYKINVSKNLTCDLEVR